MDEIFLQKIKDKALEEHIPIIMDDTLEVIANILKESKPKRILEIGTAIGYSAICFSKYLSNIGFSYLTDITNLKEISYSLRLYFSSRAGPQEALPIPETL